MSGANKVTSHCQFARGPSGPGEGEGGGHQGGAQLGILQQSLLAAMAGPGRSGRGLDNTTRSCLQGFYEQPRHLASRPQ